VICDQLELQVLKVGWFMLAARLTRAQYFYSLYGIISNAVLS